MKKALLLLAIGLTSLSASAQSKYIELKNGNENINCSFSDNPKLVFNEGECSLQAQGKSTELKEIQKITFVTFKKGDANLDTNVDVADITTVASHILGNTPSDFLKDAADANNDKTIDVADITTIATMILN
ncbi:MAG: dockerin type I repeat-containing protein [Prevotellaceae bacterium]|nr:dockerin type I repeat-containing protein [Prevotellaceae bacterium]